MSLASGRSLAALLSGCAGQDIRYIHTGLGDADPDISALERRAGQVESLLQAIERAELNIAESLGLAIQLVLNDAHVGDLASAEEVVDVTLGSIEGEVAQVGSVWGLVGERELLTGSKAAVGYEALSVGATHKAHDTEQTYQSCQYDQRRIHRQSQR